MQVNCQTLRSWQQQKKTADSLSQEFSNTVRRYSIIITGFKSALHTRMQCITFISFLVKLFQNILRYHTNDIVGVAMIIVTSCVRHRILVLALSDTLIIHTTT